ncbi:MAG TPA: PilZ domain-containing protein [Bryobacteraceae bacterium]|nr:PilZ domain-containing protein [Bryobacteraceae bacterium]
MAESRRSPRIDHSGLIFVSWQTLQGERNYALGRCLDVSEHGVGLTLPKRIPVGSFVKVQADSLSLNCSAIVRHAALRAGRYVLGLELNEPLTQEVLETLSADQSVALATA